MVRPVMLMIAFLVITSAVMFDGCSQLTAGANNTTITGKLVGSKGSNIQITAEPVNGGEVLMATPDEQGNFTLRVKPGVAYRLSGTFTASSQYAVPDVAFRYPNGSAIEEITLNPGQNVQVDYRLFVGMMTPVITPVVK